MDSKLLLVKNQIVKSIPERNEQYDRLVIYGRWPAAMKVSGEITALREVLVLIDKVESE